MENSEQPASPITINDAIYDNIGQMVKGPTTFTGLTKREYFAGQALMGLLAHGIMDAQITFAVEDSIKLADALLAELAKPETVK